MTEGNINEVEFDEEAHKYTYRGKELKGVTTIIGKRLGKNFPDSALTEMATSYGSQVHKESEDWINTGKEPTTESGKWVVEILKDMGNISTDKYGAEVRVSDFEGTASNVDIVLHTLDGVYLADIKTGNFDRTYCTMQLNAYRMMYENCYNEKVLGLMVICTKTKRKYRILQTDDNETLNLLEENKK